MQGVALPTACTATLHELLRGASKKLWVCNLITCQSVHCCVSSVARAEDSSSKQRQHILCPPAEYGLQLIKSPQWYTRISNLRSADSAELEDLYVCKWRAWVSDLRFKSYYPGPVSHFINRNIWVMSPAFWCCVQMVGGYKLFDMGM